MTDLLGKGAAWLADQRHRHLTRTVIYRRGQASVEIQATIGQTVFRVDVEYGASIRVVSRDYLVRANDLVIPPDSEPTLPQRGDRIEETDGDITFVHEVLAPGGEPEWRYSDPQRDTLRIHTKHVQSEPTT